MFKKSKLFRKTALALLLFLSLNIQAQAFDEELSIHLTVESSKDSQVYFESGLDTLNPTQPIYVNHFKLSVQNFKLENDKVTLYFKKPFKIQVKDSLFGSRDLIISDLSFPTDTNSQILLETLEKLSSSDLLLNFKPNLPPKVLMDAHAQGQLADFVLLAYNDRPKLYASSKNISLNIPLDELLKDEISQKKLKGHFNNVKDFNLLTEELSLSKSLLLSTPDFDQFGTVMVNLKDQSTKDLALALSKLDEIKSALLDNFRSPFAEPQLAPGLSGKMNCTSFLK